MYVKYPVVEREADQADGGGAGTRRPASRRFLGAALAVGLPLVVAVILYGFSGGVKSGPTETPTEEEPEWVRVERFRTDVRAFCAEGRKALAMLDGASLADLKKENQRLSEMYVALYPAWRNTDCPSMQAVMQRFGEAVGGFEQTGRVPDHIKARVSTVLKDVERWALIR
jgi:hypothetical protein